MINPFRHAQQIRARFLHFFSCEKSIMDGILKIHLQMFN